MTIGIQTSALQWVDEADGPEIDRVPLQGLWTEEQYFRLTDQTHRFEETITVRNRERRNHDTHH